MLLTSLLMTIACLLLAFPPAAVRARNHMSALKHADLVSKAIQELVEVSCAVGAPVSPNST